MFSLVFGDLDFSPDAQSGPVTVEAYGLKRGRPVPVVSVVQTLLQDGTSERVDREDNRDVTILLGIEGSDSKALADFEALLRTEVARERNELTYSPPDGFGFPSVFDVLWADLQPFEDDGWDLDEVMRGRRLYTLVLRCLPFARSVDEVSTTLTPSTSTPATINDGSSTTGWGNVNGDGSTVPDATITTTATTSGGRTVVRYGGSLQFKSSLYVSYSATAASSTFVGITVLGSVPYVAAKPAAGGAMVPPLATESDGSWVTYWWQRSTLAYPYVFQFSTYVGTLNSQFDVDGLVQSAGLPSGSLLPAPVYGSVRSAGRVELSRASGMSWVTVYADPAMEGGIFQPHLTATYANAPAGTYAYWMDQRSGTVQVTVTDSAGQQQVMTTQGQYTHPNGQAHPDLMPVGELVLGGSYGGLVGALTFEVKVNGIVVTAATKPRLFRRAPETSLTSLVFPLSGSGSLPTNVKIEAPSVDRPFGGVWGNDLGAAHRVVSWEDTTFAPPVTYLFIEANGSSTDPITSTVAYYPRHHTHATR